MKDKTTRFFNWEFLRRQLVYQTTSYRTTWKLRILVFSLILILPIATRGWWVSALGWSLVCNSEFERPDLILIDNLDTNLQLFEMAAHLRARSIGKWVLVPIAAAAQDPEKPSLLAREMAHVMVNMAQLDPVIFLPVKGGEPITLNVARDVGDFLKGIKVRKVLLLTSGFKSKRIHLIFCKVLSEIGIDTYCLPVWGACRPETWTSSWHGIQEVFLQHLKLAYYRLWVLG